MTDASDDIELTDEDLQQMLDEAIDIIAMTLPTEAGDEYWATFRQIVEARAQEMDADEEN